MTNPQNNNNTKEFELQKVHYLLKSFNTFVHIKINVHHFRPISRSHILNCWKGSHFTRLLK